MKITEYIKNTRTEMSHVTWPSRQQTIRFTSLVIAVSVATAAILGIADFVFSKLLTLFFR
jgi:preprotein translocase subunit SecE